MASSDARQDARRLLAAAPCYGVLPAGAGKTELLALCCVEVESYDLGRRTLLLTHTNAGVDVLRRRIVKVGGDPRRTRVATIAAWCETLCRQYPLLADWAVPDRVDEIGEERDFDATYAGTLGVLRSPGIQRMLRASWHTVLVDEYQDCTKQQHAVVKFLSQMLRTVVVGDYLQSIFRFTGDPVDWEIDFAGTWPSVDLATHPQRWRHTNPKLGDQLAVIRELLIRAEPVDLRRFSEIRWRKQTHASNVTRPKAAAALPGTCLVLVRYPQQTISLAKRCGGAFGSLEKLATGDLLKFASEVEEAADRGAVLQSLFALADSAMASLPKGFVARGEQVASSAEFSYQQNSKLGPVTAAALRYRSTGELADLGDVAAEMRRLPGVAVARKELWGDIELALAIARRGRPTLMDAATQIRDRARRRGRRPATHVIGTTLLAKGIEYDHVVVTNAHVLNRENLYVALTRATTSLEVLSDHPVLRPTLG